AQYPEQLPRTHEGRRFRHSGIRELSECPEGRVAVTSGCESFFRKLRKGRRQLDLMADVIYWRTWERESGSKPFGFRAFDDEN
ncbi:hypothetical protein PIB30_111860, partial [Stylosanthes scabra]|nr:hypothetical protein [Stylosanthes scabra]